MDARLASHDFVPTAVVHKGVKNDHTSSGTPVPGHVSEQLLEGVAQELYRSAILWGARPGCSRQRVASYQVPSACRRASESVAKVARLRSTGGAFAGLRLNAVVGAPLSDTRSTELRGQPRPERP